MDGLDDVDVDDDMPAGGRLKLEEGGRRELRRYGEG